MNPRGPAHLTAFNMLQILVIILLTALITGALFFKLLALILDPL